MTIRAFAAVISSALLVPALCSEANPAATGPAQAMPSTMKTALTREQINAFTDLLFADQTLEQVISANKTGDFLGPWAEFRDALEASRQGQAEVAKAHLHNILALANLETRMRLWVMAALRTLGEAPDPAASRVRGIVLQVPMHGGIDVLAAYEDGRARYINYTGKMLIWEGEDAAMSARIKAVLDQAQGAVGTVPLAARRPTTAPQGVRIVLLTDAGSHVADTPMNTLMDRAHPLNVVFTASGVLLRDLVERAVETPPQNQQK